MQQTQNEKVTCTGCGQQFNSREILQKHQKTCPAVQTAGQKRGQTQTAGGTGSSPGGDMDLDDEI